MRLMLARALTVALAVLGGRGAMAFPKLVLGNAVSPKEPLAELGVQPAPEQAPIVPDLQPDPNLSKPMDREIQPGGR